MAAKICVCVSMVQLWMNVQVHEKTVVYKTAERDVFHEAQARFSFFSRGLRQLQRSFAPLVG